MSISSHFLASTYSSFSPLANTASAICRLNDQEVPCSYLYDSFGSFVAIGFVGMIVWSAIFIVSIVSIWKIFTKANEPGWAAIVPIYNVVIMLKIINKPTWWILLSFIPFVNIIIGLIMINDFSKVFGKGVGFTLGLIFLPFIFYPILAFGDATYQPFQQPMPPVSPVPAQ